ncbi:MAG: tRNA dihydrouridine synthase DusB [Candidatus Auribacterota bacterium]
MSNSVYKKIHTPLSIGSLCVPNRVFTAPVAGISDSAYRSIVRSFGCGLCWSELIMARGITEKNEKTFDLLKIDSADRPIVVQLGGGEPSFFAQAARTARGYGADAIDINCGCPVPKMVKRGYGVGLMKEPDTIAAIVESVKKAVDIPVTVKIRAGFSREHPDAVTVAKQAEQAGADAITVHGRYRDDFFRGHSNWDVIAEVKKAVSIPVIGNGDITTAQDAYDMIAHTGCDAVMAGRSTFGRPWLIREILNGSEPDHSVSLLLETIGRHARLLMDVHGEHQGCLKLRTILMYYTKGIKHIKALRPEIIKIETAADFQSIRDAIERLCSGDTGAHSGTRP